MANNQSTSCGDGYLIEFHRVGNSVKVSAVDPATLVEVCIVGALDAGEKELTRVVVMKLEYVLARRQGD